MQQVQREEFTGPNPALPVAIAGVASGKESATRGGIMLALLVVFVVVFGLFGPETPMDTYKMMPAWFALLFGLLNLVGGLMASQKSSREIERLKAAPALPDMTWYVLDADGLVVLADGELDRGPAGVSIPWSAMQTLVVGQNGVFLKYRLPKALSPDVLRLPADRTRSDGTRFDARLKALFDARQAAEPMASSFAAQGV